MSLTKGTHEMAKSNKIETEEVLPTYQKSRLQSVVAPIIDRIFQVGAAVFFIATSYAYVSGWFKSHQAHSDLSVASAIMVIAIALYLFTRRKR